MAWYLVNLYHSDLIQHLQGQVSQFLVLQCLYFIHTG